jgi:uncharacterized protein involved in exopolysaccharide biosynthesis
MRRKRLLVIWGLVTIAATIVVVLTIARPLYRAEGKFSYRPNYSRGAKPIYTPPNIQSAVQILKSTDVLDPVRAKHVPEMSKEEFSKNVRVEVSKQSEFIDIGFDHPDPKVAGAVTDDLMTEGLKYFTDVRAQTMKDAVAQVEHDLKSARKQLEIAKEDYRKAYEARGIGDPLVELDTIKSALTDIETQLRVARERQAKVKLEIKFLEARRDAPADASDAALDESFFPILQSMMQELQSKMINQQSVDTAKIRFESAQSEERRLRPLVAKGIYPQIEYDKVVAEMRIHEATLKHADEVKELREDLQKRYDELRKKAASGKPVRRAVIEDLERLRKEEATAPATIAVLSNELDQKRKSLADLQSLKRELGEKDDNIKLMWTRVQDFHSQLTDAAERTQDLNANDLRVHSSATAGTTPYSTNAPKLGLAMVGASALMLIGYLALFALPAAAQSPVGSATNSPALPRALVALVPYIQQAKGRLGGTHSANTPAGDGLPPSRPASQPEVQAIAKRILEDGVDPGGIVLFAPTAENLQVAPVMGGLGEVFGQRGDRVLIFDARQTAETPDWAGPQAPVVARNVEGYLDGQADGATDCFVSTNLSGVEYSRADLTSHVSGVMAVHRFRQLVEEMRERYSVVFLVGPPVSLDESDPLLAMMAEGMVLVTESSADPVQVHAYLDTLCQKVPARLYGTLEVPKAA